MLEVFIRRVDNGIDFFHCDVALNDLNGLILCELSFSKNSIHNHASCINFCWAETVTWNMGVEYYVCLRLLRNATVIVEDYFSIRGTY